MRSYCGLFTIGWLSIFPAVGIAQQEEPEIPRAVPVVPQPAPVIRKSQTRVLRGIPVEPTPAVRRAVPVRPAPTPTPKPFLTPTPRPTPKPKPTPPPTPVPVPPRSPAPVEKDPTYEPPTPKAVPFDTGQVSQQGSADDSVIHLAPSVPSTRAVSQDEVQFRVASGLFNKKLYTLAIPEFEKYIVRFPGGQQRAAAMFRLGECFRELDIKMRAQDTYRKLLTEYRSGELAGSAAYRLAEIATKDEDFETAAHYFEKAAFHLREPRLKLAAQFREARSLETLGRRESARASYRKVLKVKEDNPYTEASLLALAQLTAAGGRKTEAFRYYDELAATTENPKVRAEAAVNAGVLGCEIGKTQRAAAHFQKVLSMPDAGDWRNVARLGLLRLAYQEERYADVIKTYSDNPEEISPELRPEALLLVANSHRQLGDHKAAGELYDQVIREYGDSTFARDAKYQRLVSLYSTDDDALIPAVDGFLETTSTGAKADQARLLKAEALYKKQDFAAAAVVYEQLVHSTLGADFKADVLYKLGWCKAQTSDIPGAISAYTTFLAEYGESSRAPQIIAQRGLLYQKRGDFDAALTDFNDLVANYPDAAERQVALQQKALILGQKKDNAGMAATFAKLLVSYPDTDAAAQANYWIGWVAFEDKKYSEAISSLDAARKADEESYYERASLRIVLANYYMEKLADTTAAVDDYLSAERQKMIPSEILRWLGTEYFGAEKFAESAKYLTALTGRENPAPIPVDSWLYLAKSRLQLRDWEGVIEAVQPCLTELRDASEKADAYLTLAQAQLGLLDFEATQAAVDEVLGLQPEGIFNARARMVAAEIQMRLNQFGAAAKEFQRIALLYDDYVEVAPQALERAHSALVQLGEAEKAEEVMNELRSRYPEYRLQASR